jgi:hypothetical protein
VLALTLTLFFWASSPAPTEAHVALVGPGFHRVTGDGEALQELAIREPRVAKEVAELRRRELAKARNRRCPVSFHQYGHDTAVAAGAAESRLVEGENDLVAGKGQHRKPHDSPSTRTRRASIALLVSISTRCA